MCRCVRGVVEGGRWGQTSTETCCVIGNYFSLKVGGGRVDREQVATTPAAGGVPGAPSDADLSDRARTYALWPLWTLLLSCAAVGQVSHRGWSCGPCRDPANSTSSRLLHLS